MADFVEEGVAQAEEGDKRGRLDILIEDNPAIFMSGEDIPEEAWKTDEYGNEYVEPLIDVNKRCHYYYTTSYLKRLLIVFTIVTLLCIANLATITNDITIWKITGVIILAAVSVNTGFRLFAISFFGKPMPGIPFFSDVSLNTQPIIEEVRHERAAKAKRKEQERSISTRRSIIPSFLRRSNKRKTELGFSPRVYMGIRSPGTLLGERLERMGLTVKTASDEIDGKLSPSTIADMINNDAHFDDHGVVAASSITGMSVKEFEDAISAWDDVKDMYEQEKE